ncbi:MAG: hypothetical protein KKD56_05295 [Acidobacteria bacterium]|nr:hypothetical protein [Acidobacteriota bacterium]MCG2815801.1 hypothetical protein [Candidatus Aminicenantes bacterium]MBU1474651.1 hypothetical protein [Acidobacteriota bacterium]MBU2437940.1 hypothetical protein [Acidobacteriota bacterium]MBU4202801.1 hypothetical protein [Acidobacteriota bacterium]
MIFGLVVCLSLVIVSILLHRLKQTSIIPAGGQTKGYGAWLWTGTHYTALGRWFFFGMTGSYAVMALTGFLGSGLGLFRLQGLLLVAHVSVGGIYALCTAVVLFLRGGDMVDFSLRNEEPETRARSLSNGAFWLYALSAMLLTLTALSMMLAFVPFQLIRTAFLLHRVFALVSLCAALFWFGLQRPPTVE